jgi:hypothetical protein
MVPYRQLVTHVTLRTSEKNKKLTTLSILGGKGFFVKRFCGKLFGSALSGYRSMLPYGKIVVVNAYQL